MRCVFGLVLAEVSKGSNAFIFRIRRLLDLEDEGTAILRNHVNLKSMSNYIDS
jgi:hypothetical protein